MGFSCSCVTKPNQNKTPLPISKAYFLLSVHVSQQHAVLETLLESGRVTSSQGITLVNFNLMLTLKLVKKRLKHICNIQPTTWNWDLTAFYLGITYYAILQSWFIPVNPRPMFTLKRSQFLGIMTSEYRAHINPAKKKNQLFKYCIHNRQHSEPTDSDRGWIYLNIHPELLCMWSSTLFVLIIYFIYSLTKPYTTWTKVVN